MTRRVPIEERVPGGVRGGLEYLSAAAPYDFRRPDLSDCLAVRPKRFRLVIWEPLRTKAPGPHLAQPYCCYISTIIFYHRPYIPKLAKSYWRDGNGVWRVSSAAFEEWDQIETRLDWDDRLQFEGEVFVKGGGSVVWAQKRWWLRHDARRMLSPMPQVAA